MIADKRMLVQDEGILLPAGIRYVIDRKANTITYYPKAGVSTSYVHNWQLTEMFLTEYVEFARWGKWYLYRQTGCEGGIISYTIEETVRRPQVPPSYGGPVNHMKVMATVLTGYKNGHMTMGTETFFVESGLHHRICATLDTMKGGNELENIAAVVANHNTSYLVNTTQIGATEKLSMQYYFSYVIALKITRAKNDPLSTYKDFIKYITEYEGQFAFILSVKKWWKEFIEGLGAALVKISDILFGTFKETMVYSITPMIYDAKTAGDQIGITTVDWLIRQGRNLGEEMHKQVSTAVNIATTCATLGEYQMCTEWYNRGVRRRQGLSPRYLELGQKLIDAVREAKAQGVPQEQILAPTLPEPEIVEVKCEAIPPKLSDDEYILRAITTQRELMKVHEQYLSKVALMPGKALTIPTTDGSYLYTVAVNRGEALINLVADDYAFTTTESNVVHSSIFEPDKTRCSVMCVVRGGVGKVQFLKFTRRVNLENNKIILKTDENFTGVVSFTRDSAAWMFPLWVEIYESLLAPDLSVLKADVHKRLRGLFGMAGYGKTWSLVSELFKHQACPLVLASTITGREEIRHKWLSRTEEDDPRRNWVESFMTVDLFLLKANSLIREIRAGKSIDNIRIPDEFGNLDWLSDEILLDEALAAHPAKMYAISMSRDIIARFITGSVNKNTIIKLYGDPYQALFHQYRISGVTLDDCALGYWLNVVCEDFKVDGWRCGIDAMVLLTRLYSSHPILKLLKGRNCRTHNPRLRTITKAGLYSDMNSIVASEEVIYLALETTTKQSLKRVLGQKARGSTVLNFNNLMRRIKTVNESQGQSTTTVVLVRESKTTATPYLQTVLSLLILALSRHTTHFEYLTPRFAGDKVVELLDWLDETMRGEFNYRPYMVDESVEVISKTRPEVKYLMKVN